MAHKSSSYWFTEIAVITIEHFATQEEALAAEHTAIARENPRYNVHGGIRVEARRERQRRSRHVPAEV
jgi:hypothetical protein